ncbi:MFS transporter [Phenylobacterium terrae]|uniref:MFS transporter n=1 Tax=Phenylobacterium terrae TaxID=2665495 RepID=A0ABW4N2U2_9CAUL
MSEASALNRNPDFLKLWSAQAIAEFGARITREGLPIAAVLTLSAGPQALGLLSAVRSAAGLAVGLTLGGFVDRRPRRRLMIGMDVLRAAALVTIPAAALMGWLSLAQIFVVGAIVAAASALFAIAAHAYLPGLIAKAQLTEGNARLSATESVAEVGGPALAGVLFQWLTAPAAIALNAVTYAASAALLGAIRKPEPAPEPEPPATLLKDLRTGAGAAWSEPRVRALLLMGAVTTLFGSFFAATYVVFALQTLGLTPSLLGLTIAAGGAGALAGSVAAGPLSRALGAGPAILLGFLGWAAANVLIPLAPADPVLGTAALVTAQILGDGLAVASLVLAASLRQSLVPQNLLGRVGATFHAAEGAAGIAGALAGGLLAEQIGLRGAMFVAVAGMALAPLIGLMSPLRQVREIGDR